MRVKKILSLTLAVLMMVSSFAFALPNGTLVIDDQAYDFQYVINNQDEISNTFTASSGKVYYKDYEGQWAAVVGDVVLDDIPAVTYHSADGTTTEYAAKDGDPVVPNEDRAVVITNEAVLVQSSDDKLLIGDGETTYLVEVKVNTPDGKPFKGTLEFLSTAGVSASVEEISYSEQTKSFIVKIPNYTQDRPDTISVRIKDSSTHRGLKLKESQQINLIYQGKAAGSVVTKTEYDVLVDAVNEQWTDRVSVSISNVSISQEQALMAAIEKQLKVYNQYALEAGNNVMNNVGNVVSVIVDQRTVNENDATKADYVFHALLDVPKDVPQKTKGDFYDPKYVIPRNFYLDGGIAAKSVPGAGIVAGDTETYLAGGPGGTPYYFYPLIDNGYNKYEISLDSAATVKLAQKGLSNLVKPPVDANQPFLAAVYANVEGLRPNSIVVEFSEPMDTLTAENPEVYTINGVNLKFDDKYPGKRDVYLDAANQTLYRSIELLDVIGQYAVGDPRIDYINAIKARIEQSEGEGAFDVNNDPRRFVIIELTNKAARRILVDTTSAATTAEMNKLDVQRAFDVAGVSNHVNENMIQPVPLYFPYVSPEEVKGLELIIHSPEQYNIVVEDMYMTENSANMFDLSTPPSGINTRVGLVLQGYGTRPNFAVPADQFTVIPYVNDQGKDGYLIELKKDWTYLLTQPNAYHGRLLSVCLYGVAYDGYGHKVLDTTVAGDLQMRMCDSKVLEEDVVSPVINQWNTVGSMGSGADKIILPSGSMALEFSEPMQFLEWRTTTDSSIALPLDAIDLVGTTSGAAIDSEVFVVSHEFTEPNVTASQEQVFDQVGADDFARYEGGEFYQQFNEYGIGVPSFEYVRINSLDDLTSQAERYHGRIVEGSVPSDDYNCIVQPVDAAGNPINLRAGFWKLVARQATDDVGNSMCTKQMPFELTGTVVEEGYVNPYVLWAYAAEAQQTESGQNDVIRILFSRKMTNEAYDLASYSFGDQTFEEASTPTVKYVELYHKGEDQNGNEILYRDIDTDKNGAWIGTLVTLTLDDRTFEEMSDIQTGNGYLKMALKIDNMKAVDDGDPRSSEDLLFDNNNGSNNFYLTFSDDTPLAGTEDMVTNNTVLVPFRYDMGAQNFRSPYTYYQYADQ